MKNAQIRVDLLTEKERARFEKLVAKAASREEVRLTRAEIKRIENAFSGAGQKSIIITRRPGKSIRVFSIDGHKKLVAAAAVARAAKKNKAIVV